jgi:hypothetical protein
MAFGFLVEKFDLFLEFAAPSLVGRTLSLPGQKFGNIAGLTLIVLGTAMVGTAAARFVMTAKNIDREDLRPGTGSRIDITCRAAGASGLRSIFICRMPLSRSSDDCSRSHFFCYSVCYVRSSCNVRRKVMTSSRLNTPITWLSLVTGN